MSILDTAFALITSRGRSIGGIIPDVTVREVHRDEMIITDHPTEMGAPVSDHAFMRPKEVEISVGWSNCSGQSAGYIHLVYQELLSLQRSRQPFFVTTGKRAYSNMLIASLTETTEPKTEESLMIQARLREIIIASTGSTGTPASAQANPASTGATESVGQVQATAYGFGRGA